MYQILHSEIYTNLHHSAQPTRLLQVANVTLVQQKALFASDLPELPATSAPSSIWLVLTLVSSILHPTFQTNIAMYRSPESSWVDSRGIREVQRPSRHAGPRSISLNLVEAQGRQR